MNNLMRITPGPYRLKAMAAGNQHPVEIAPEHTALVVMHAWNSGTFEEYPGWFRYVEYKPRARQICQVIFPELLATVRPSPLKLFHVVGGGNYYRDYPGYRKAVQLAGPEPPPLAQIDSDPALEKLHQFKSDLGHHNRADIERGFANIDFAPEARPAGEEGIAENAHQLFALCRESGVNHLIYAGFAINWCLLLSPGGMADMRKHGIMCSALRQAVTAVENKETAHAELNKQSALWRVALDFGFVFDVDDLVHALGNLG